MRRRRDGTECHSLHALHTKPSPAPVCPQPTVGIGFPHLLSPRAATGDHSMPRFLALLLFVCALPVLGGCGGCGGNRSAQRINGGGATFVNPIMQKWSGEYK